MTVSLSLPTCNSRIRKRLNEKLRTDTPCAYCLPYGLSSVSTIRQASIVTNITTSCGFRTVRVGKRNSARNAAGNRAAALGWIGLRGIGSSRAVAAIGLCIRRLHPNGHRGDVATFDITEVAHPAHEFLAEWIVARGSRPDVPDARHLARLLRARRERPCGYTAADKYDEFPPPHGAYPKAKDHGQSIAGVGVGQWRASQQKAAPHDRFRVLRWVKGGNPSTHKELFCDGHHIAGAAAALTSKLPHEHEGELRWPGWFVPLGGSLAAYKVLFPP